MTSTNMATNPQTEQVCLLKCDFRDTEALLTNTQKEKVLLPNALVKINLEGEFFTSILNARQYRRRLHLAKLIWNK